MESSEDKQWAAKYILDPLNAPQSSDETGPGSTFAPLKETPSPSTSKLQKKAPSVSIRPSNAPSNQVQKAIPATSTGGSSNNPYRKATTNSSGYPTPPQSVSPQKERFSVRSETFPDFDGSYTPTRQSVDQASTQIPTSTGGHGSSTTGGHRRRTSSLNQRYPGDQTHRPLHMIKKETRAADRAPHLRKTNHVGADSIDRLDDLAVAGPYHHEGPYDATLQARNAIYTNSPIEAVSSTNEEALKATPREMVKDAVEKHRPLDGTAMVPPGVADQYGNTYDYQEGTDMMIDNNPEGGAYKRYPGMQYLPEDLKGKGEPAYSLEKALKEHKKHGRNISEGSNGIEMTTPAEHRRPMSTESRPFSDGQKYADWESNVQRSNSGAGKLRKRFGSLRIK